jgi:hypothetical protein
LLLKSNDYNLQLDNFCFFSFFFPAIQIQTESITKFAIGEIVQLKSNPEITCAVINISIQAQEEVEQVEEAVDAIGQLQKIKDTHQHGTVNHKDGSASKVDAQTAHAVLTVHKSLNDVNKKKFADMVARSSHHMQKAAEFSWKHLK